MKRWSYEPAKTILMITLGWNTLGIPRLFGLMPVKPEYAANVFSLDATMLSLLVLSFLYSAFAIFMNARIKTKRTKGENNEQH